MKVNWNRFRFTRSIRIEFFWVFLLSSITAIAVSVTVNNGIVTIIYNEKFKNLHPYNPIIVYIPTIIFVVAFALIFHYMTRPTVKYILTLAEGIETIAEGDLNYRVLAERNDELGKVALNINLMTERLQEQMSKEREIETSKMELITGISHDLRTPLTSIIGYVDLLKTNSYQNKEEYNRFITNTYNKAIHLKELVDNLFDYTRLASSDAQMNLSEVDIHQLLSQMLFEFEPLALEHGLQINKNLGSKPVTATIDSGKMARALDNLLMNAIKYSKKPGMVNVAFQADDRRFYVEIENNGPSLTSEQEKKIFDRFYKVDHSRSSDQIQSGSGLGLSIARSIIELHAGTLTLRHHNGIYTFMIEIPLKGSSA